MRGEARSGMGLRASGLRFGQEAAWMSVSLVRQSAVQPHWHELVCRHHASNETEEIPR